MSQTHGYSLECRKLCKTFNINNKTVRVVDEFSYVFQSGKLYVLKGSSGSGKSTLLSLLSLIQECECGEIYLSNQRVDNLDEHEKQLLLLKKFGVVFQDSNLLTGLTVYDNIILASACENSLCPEQIASRAKENMMLLGLEEISGSYPMQISGGERQRSGIARAIMNNPAVLICDEPISSLDEDNAGIIIRFLTDYCHRENKIVIISCHSSAFDDQADAIIHMGGAEL